MKPQKNRGIGGHRTHGFLGPGPWVGSATPWDGSNNVGWLGDTVGRRGELADSARFLVFWEFQEPSKH